MKDAHRAQRYKILDLLLDAHGGWVPLPKIAHCAAQYNARIFELRRLGFRIPKPRIKTVNGQKHSWYRLESAPVQPIAKSATPADALSPLQPVLFTSRAPERWVDPEEGGW